MKLLLSVVLLATLAANAEPLSIGETFTLRSEILKEERRINVYVPAGQAETPLPVLYMPDGGVAEDFVHVAGLVQVLTGNGAMRPFLLVGIENTQRRRDLTGPTENAEDRKIAPAVGGSAKFRAFLRDELMPEIEKRYRTTKERAIVGESLAGLFVVETFVLEPELFDTYLAFDPSLWWNDGKLTAEAAKRLASDAALAKTLYVATSDEPGIVAATGRFVEVLRASKREGLRWHHEPLPEEKHSTIYHPAALRAFRKEFAAKAAPADSLAGYQDCVMAAMQANVSGADILVACEAPAKAGIPGAQYAMGVFLVLRNQAGDRTAGLEWLEKAVEAQNPAAAFALGSMLFGENSPASLNRARDLVKHAVCEGYELAVSTFAKEGVTRDKLDCPPPRDADFTGEWVADLEWVKIEPVGAGGPQLKVEFEGGAVRVFMKHDAEWREVKPGKFKLQQLEQSVMVSAIDSGWDFDGKWIETWSLQLQRLGADEATITFLRTVNNPHVPASLSFRTFSTLAEGKARRTRPAAATTP